AEHGDAELDRLVEDLLRGLAVLVGLQGRGADLVRSEGATGLLEHLLLVVGREVEEALRLALLRAGGFAQRLGGLEGAAGSGRGLEAVLGALEDGLLDPFTDADAIQEVGAGEAVQRPQAV